MKVEWILDVAEALLMIERNIHTIGKIFPVTDPRFQKLQKSPHMVLLF